MALIVNTNMAALNAQRNLGLSQSTLGRSIERLSSGLRINKAADDPAGIAIATKFATQVRGLNQAVRNANNAIALAQTAEGGINTVTNILHRLRELAVQSSSDDNTPADRGNLALEADSLIAELTRTVNTTEYNTMPLLDGGFTSKYFQIGSNYGQTITFTINDTRGRSLGGRAEYSADIADGVLNALNANFGAAEFKINTYGVATTNASDDQYSVLDISSSQIDSTSLTLSALLTKAGFTSTTSTVALGSILSMIVVGDTAISLFTQLDGVTEASAYVGSGTTLETDVVALVNSFIGNDLMTITVGSVISALGTYLSAGVGGSTLASYNEFSEVYTLLQDHYLYQNNSTMASAIAIAVASAIADSGVTGFDSIESIGSYTTDLSTANAVTSFGALQEQWFTGIASITIDALEDASVTYTVEANQGATVSLHVALTIEGVAISVVENLVIASNESTVAYNSNLSFNALTSNLVSGASLAQAIVDAVNNNASLTAMDIVARQVNGSGWLVERTGGGNLQILASLNIGIDGGAVTATAFTLIDSASFNVMGAESLVVTGSAIVGNGGDLASAGLAPIVYNGESSAIAKAVAINTIRSNSGVTATALTNTVTGTATVTAGTINSGDLYINGVNMGTITVAASDSTGALVTAINNQSKSTGVTASTDASSQLVLTAADGRNITVTVETATIRGYLGLDSNQFTGTTAIFRSTVRLNDDEEFTLTGTLADLYDETNDYTKTTETSKSVASDMSTYNVAGISIATQSSAQAAILTVDAALDDINANRADLGAIQTRLEFAVANLQIASENMSASESRIRDADFAWEVGQFTRSQILMQAGVAMLAQSNTLPQVALQLLG